MNGYDMIGLAVAVWTLILVCTDMYPGQFEGEAAFTNQLPPRVEIDPYADQDRRR